MTDHQHPHPTADPDATTSSAVTDAAPVTVLPLAVPGDRVTNLRVIADADQEVDHSHHPIPPVSPGGFPYRYKVRLRGRTPMPSPLMRCWPCSSTATNLSPAATVTRNSSR